MDKMRASTASLADQRVIRSRPSETGLLSFQLVTEEASTDWYDADVAGMTPVIAAVCNA